MLTVGNIDKAQATLVDLDYNVIEIPRYLLPPDSTPGTVLKMTLSHDLGEEDKR